MGRRRSVGRRPLKRILFWVVYALLLAGLTVGGLEFASIFFAPAWPAFELRPIKASSEAIREIKTLATTPQYIPFYNSWGVKDRERSVTKPTGIQFRSIVVGDSFVEGAFALPTVTDDVEQDWASMGITDMEAVNLGISATGPPQYYYRIKRIALDLQPDAIVLVFYTGNDFISQTLSPWSMPPFIDELPEPSVLGTVAPHLTWLAVNRLALSEYGRGNKPIPNEFDILAAILKKPRADRPALLAQHLKTYYFPNKDLETMREILARGGDRFWDAFEDTGSEREFLMGWMIATLVDNETGTWKTALDAAEADQLVSPREIDATMSWLTAARDLVEASGKKFLIAIAPMASMDPRYVEFWKPWPRYYAWNPQREAARRRLEVALRARGINVIDLSQTLAGVPGTYRLTDGHWTSLGTAIAAKAIGSELLKARGIVRAAQH
ncbi:MAG: SGNH/GDSL hydrolase family protein [Proteobacteria bacterium]|nr:SGNH/GDSL hydrolase family protein [Pseudomonadota bacterium]